MRQVTKMAFEDGNQEAEHVFHAFTYQVSKEIGSMAAVLSGKVDQIILTGGIAYGEKVVEEIKARVALSAASPYMPARTNFWLWHRAASVC